MDHFFLSNLVLFLKLLGFIFLLLFIYNLISPFLSGAPYLPTPYKKVKKMLELAKLKSGEKLVDLGCGDGRVLIEAAKLGVEAIGYEIDPILVYFLRKKIKKLGLEDKIKVYWKNFWKADLSEADVIVFYGITHIMKRMERKLLKELKPGARVCCYIFPFPEWEPEKYEDGIFLYKK